MCVCPHVFRRACVCVCVCVYRKPRNQSAFGELDQPWLITPEQCYWIRSAYCLRECLFFFRPHVHCSLFSFFVSDSPCVRECVCVCVCVCACVCECVVYVHVHV